jgi:hypothetical protein
MKTVPFNNHALHERMTKNKKRFKMSIERQVELCVLNGLAGIENQVKKLYGIEV